MITKNKIILASASPRRQSLLSDAGFEFEVVPCTIDEPRLPPGEMVDAHVWVESLAFFKARCVKKNYPDAIVIGADTIVSHSNQIIGKPKDESDARRMLTNLFGGKNEVITGVAILPPAGHEMIVTHVSTTLTMREMNPDEVERYLASGAWKDKAGAYALQEGGDQFLESMDGSYSNVVGLPMEKLTELLEPFKQ